MKKVISVFMLFGFAVLGSSYAQNAGTGDLFDQRLQNYQRVHGELIKYLKKVGDPSIGYYPFCSDLIRLYQEEQKTIAALLYKKHEMSFADLDVALDWNTISKNQIPHYTGETMATAIGLYKSSGGGCFDEKTPIQTLMVRQDLDLSKIQYVQTADHIEKLNEDIDNAIGYIGAKFNLVEVEIGELQNATTNTFTTHNPYILSSTYVVIPDIRYQKDCWGKINQIYYAQVEHGESMSALAVRNTQTRIFSTQNHRFLVCGEDPADSSKCHWVRSKDISAGTQLYAGENKRINVVAAVPYKIEDSWMGIDNDRDVYNLNTETFTYYVGNNENRVLVHNVK